MSAKKIGQLIDDIYEYIEGCKPKGFSSTQVIVMKDEMFDLLDELRVKIPDAVQNCTKMLANRDQIIANAEERAERIIADAKLQAESLVQESEIMRQAYMQANEMVSRASQQADSIMQSVTYDVEQMKAGALAYTNDMLSEIERVISQTYEATREKAEAMLHAMEQNLEIVRENRRELNEDIAPEEPHIAGTSEYAEHHAEDYAYEDDGEEDYDDEDDDDEDDYDDLDGDSFFRNVH